MGAGGRGATGSDAIAAAQRRGQRVATTSMQLFQRSLLAVFAIVLAGLLPAAGHAEAAEGGAGEQLKRIVARQRALLARAEAAEHQVDIDDLRPRLQELVFDYERYLRENPDEPAGYVSYSLLLGHPLLDERKRAAALLLKANELDPNLAIVKNQLGNYLAEEGRPVEAINYFLSAVQLEPEEPLYHFQIGQLLSAARDDFLKSGEWTSEQIETAMKEAYRQATTLAPDNLAYAYGQAESFHALEDPDWDAALRAWRDLEKRLGTTTGRQTARLQQASILIKQGREDEAKAVLETVREPVLQADRERLLAEAAATPAEREAEQSE